MHLYKMYIYYIRFSPVAPVSSTNKTDHHDRAEIWLKVALNTIYQHIHMYSIISQFVAQTNHTNNYYLENGYGIMYMYIFLLHSFLFSDKNHRNKCDFQLPIQSMPITTYVVSSNLDLCEVYSIM
jgi:hypothetical protein